jgi:hypothetical protein
MAFGKWIHRVFILATSLVPLAGVLWFGWSASTLLAVFWGETLLAGTANVVRIGLHRRLTRAQGHWRRHLQDSSKRAIGKIEPQPETTFLAEYAMILYVFTLAHGLFLGIFLVILNQNWRGEGPSPWQIDGNRCERHLSPSPASPSSSSSTTCGAWASSLSPGSRRECRSLSGVW